MKKTIFLDFDGVLHGEGINSKGFFEHVDTFCNFLRPYKDEVEIVISSSWREDKTLEELKEFFHEDLKEIFKGVTPKFPNKESYALGGREKEILQYCSENDITNWIALDDQSRFFSLECKNLILVDSETGINQKNLEELKSFILMKNSLKINKRKL
jgi:hypothetical protein